MAGSYEEARRRQVEGSPFENQGDAEEAIEDTLAIVDILLAACEEMMQGCGFCECRPFHDCKCTNCTRMQAAIAKAKGV